MQGCYVRVADWVYAHTVGILVMAAVIAVVEVSMTDTALSCRNLGSTRCGPENNDNPVLLPAYILVKRCPILIKSDFGNNGICQKI